ncbi:MAG: secretin N-terminal domain-containing protein [Bdellovibrionota bacterium]
MKKRTIVALMSGLLCCLSFSITSMAKDSSGNVRVKTGEMSLMAYLEGVSEVLGLQISASDLKGQDGPTVSVSFGGPMTREQAMAQMYSVLALRGYTLIHEANIDVYHLLRMRDARDSNLPLIIDQAVLPEDDSMVTHAIQMKYIPAEAVARNLRSLAPVNSRLIPDEGTNTLFITDSARAMKKYHAIVSRMDTPKAADEAKDYLKKRSKADACAAPEQGSNYTIFIVLFSLIGLILGFLIRGYVIRRIEGGL